MHRALERQFGASNVDIDSIDGWIRFTLPEAQKFDFNQMFDTFDGANYEIYTIEVVVKAKYEATSSGPGVVLAGTGQTFPFEGAKQWSGTQRIHAMAVGWKQFAPKLVWIKPSIVGANWVSARHSCARGLSNSEVTLQLKQFERSLSGSEPPAGLNDALRVLWFDGRGDWEAAHNIAQDMVGQDGAWLHGFLHRREGDLPNADYWYRRAGKNRPDVDLEGEWRALVTWFGADRSGPA